MGVTDYWIDKLLFLLCVGYWVSYGFVPGIGGAKRNAKNFMYGARGCVDELVHEAGIDMLDGHKAHQAGFFAPIFSSSRFYGANQADFYVPKEEGDVCFPEQDAFADLDVNGEADCTRLFPYNTTGNLVTGIHFTGDEHNRLRPASTFRQNYATTTTTAEGNENAAPDATELNKGMPTIPSRAVGLVLNLDEDQLFAPNMKDASSRCEKVLERVRTAGSDYDIFEEDQLPRVLICSAMFGWPLGEYCDTWEHHTDLFEHPGNFPTPTEEQSSAMNAKCHYASRKQCLANSVWSSNAHLTTTGVGDGNAGDLTGNRMSFLAEGPGNNAEDGIVNANRNAQLIDTPCIMVNGVGKSPFKITGQSGVYMADQDGFYGSLSSPRANSNYFATRRSQDDLAQFMETDGGKYRGLVGLKPTGAIKEVEFTTGGRTDPDPVVDVEEDMPFALVETPLGETDLHYLAERMIKDVIFLANMAEAVDRGQEFWNKLDARCFNDGITSETHIGILISGILIGFVTLGTLQKSFGVVNCFPFIDACKGSMGITWLNINNYVLAIFGGLLGLVASYGWGGFAVESGAHNNDLLQWALPFKSLHLSAGDQGENAEDPSVTAAFLNDLSNGDFHHAINLTSGEAAAIHALTAMSLCILVVASFKTTVKSEEKSDGTYDGWENPGALLKA